jgi:probable phosphoglycerate mutase
VTTLHLVRHGESGWNARGLVQGQTYDVPLTARGREQALLVARQVAILGPTYVVTSDLLRAVQTTAAIERATGLVADEDTRLRERSYGEDEGRPCGEVPALGDPDLVSPGGESFADVVTRVRGWLTDLRRARPDDVVVAVTHGDVIAAAVVCLELPRLGAPHGNGSVLAAGLLSGVRA